MNLNMQNCHHRSLQANAAAAIPACLLQPQPPPGPSPPRRIHLYQADPDLWVPSWGATYGVDH
jgi:hypothetical protein